MIRAGGISITAADPAGAAAAAQAASQPVDTDLTAIAALATTTYGRAFLALANQAAGRAVLGFDAVVSKTFATAPSGTPYAIAAADETVLVDPVGGNCGVQLPAASALTGRIVTIKRTTNGPNTVTITSAGGNVDNALPAVGFVLLGSTLASGTFRADGVNWWVV